MKNTNYETNKKIAETRHNKTDYDKYDVFYHVYLDSRKKLNWCCAQFNNEELDLIDFVDSVNTINSDVNLFRKSNQKRFIEQNITELRAMYPDKSNSSIKDFVKKMLKNILLNQERRNSSRVKYTKLYFIED